MAIKFYYDEEDDILSIYDSLNPPKETVEFSEFLNIDINKDRGIVGLEIFYASEFFGALNNKVDKEFLKELGNISIECKNYRNTWFLVLVINKNNESPIKIPMPPFRKSEYKSPLIASCE